MIGLVPGQIITESLVDEPLQRGGEALADPERDLAKVAVVERHLGTGRIGLGFVRGFGLRRGALGSTLSHDAHNAVDRRHGRHVDGVRGAAAREHRRRHRRRRRRARGRGAAAARGGDPVGRASRGGCRASEAVVAAARELGCEIDAPLQSLAFLALSVIPALKITDRGLVDVERFELVPLQAE